MPVILSIPPYGKEQTAPDLYVHSVRVARHHYSLAGVAEAARNLRLVRAEIRAATPMSLRELYRTLDLPGANRLRDAQAALDRAVGEAYRYGLPPDIRNLEPLPLLLALNQRCAAAEGEGRAVVGPGLPAFCDGDRRFLSDDCLRMPGQ